MIWWVSKTISYHGLSEKSNNNNCCNNNNNNNKDSNDKMHGSSTSVKRRVSFDLLDSKDSDSFISLPTKNDSDIARHLPSKGIEAKSGISLSVIAELPPSASLSFKSNAKPTNPFAKTTNTQCLDLDSQNTSNSIPRHTKEVTEVHTLAKASEVTKSELNGRLL
uniref:Uncharacterized protein n=2 Tax=Lygus hesperus TaxID=30085 RepID=A0A0A9WPJ7_LYGHE